MNFQHKELALGRWQKFDLLAQMANIGSEIERTISWREKGNTDYSNKAFERALELLYLTIDDPKNKHRLKEPIRLYEVMVDYFMGDNQFCSSDQLWRNYFRAFNYATSLKTGR